MIVEESAAHPNDQANAHVTDLLEEHLGRILVINQREIPTGRVNHQCAKKQQGKNSQQQGDIKIEFQMRPGSLLAPAAAALGSRGLCFHLFENSLAHSSFIIWRKRRSRSSKSTNSSKLVPPGESSTMSPGCAVAAAACTAAARLGTRVHCISGATRLKAAATRSPASPKQTTWWTRSMANFAKSSQGKPLSRPPKSSTMGRSNARRAASARCGAVAIESLYQSTRLRLRTHSRRCGAPRKPRAPVWIASTDAPAAAAKAQAAHTLYRLCSPSNSISESANSSRSPASSRNHMAAPRI